MFLTSGYIFGGKIAPIFTLAQKMVGKACSLPGVHPGMSCEPLMTTVGSQDTTDPMTRDEMKELAWKWHYSLLAQPDAQDGAVISIIL